MPSKLFVIFLLVFALWASTGTAVAQEGGVLVNLRVDEKDTMFVNLEVVQVGNRCVASHLSNFTLFRWDLGIGWQPMGFSPMVEVGNFSPAMRWGPEYRFPATKNLYRFFVGSALRSPTIMVALPGYQMAGVNTGECAPVVLNQGAFLVTGRPEAFPFDYKGVGSFSRNVIATDEYLHFEVVGRNTSRVVVLQEIRLSGGQTATWQKVMNLPAGGGPVSIPQHSLMQGVAVDVIIHDAGGAVVRENLTTGTRKFVLNEDGTVEFLMERLDSPYRELFAPSAQ